MEPKKALIISFSGIGDAVLTEVLCENLKKIYKDITVDMVVKDNSFPLFLNNPNIDNVIPYYNKDRKKVLEYIKKTWRVTRKKYDIILDVESTPRSELFSLFGISAKFRMGWYKISKHKFLGMKVKRGFFYNNKIIRNNKKNVVENIIKFIEPLLKDTSLENYEKVYEFKINITDKEKEDAKKLMENIGMNLAKKTIICGVNAVSGAKRWKREYMAEVLKYILDNYDYQLLFFYTPNEKEYTVSLAEELKSNKVFYGIETKDSRDLAKLMVNCDYYFGNEGGARHIAQALELPSLAIFSPDAAKKDWLVNNGNFIYDGIESGDILGDEVYKMNERERYDVIRPDHVLEKLKPKLDELKKRT